MSTGHSCQKSASVRGRIKIRDSYDIMDQYLYGSIDVWDISLQGVQDAVGILQRIYLTVTVC